MQSQPLQASSQFNMTLPSVYGELIFTKRIPNITHIMWPGYLTSIKNFTSHENSTGM